MLRALARRAGGAALRASSSSPAIVEACPPAIRPLPLPRAFHAPPPSSRAVPPLGVGAAIASVGARSVLGLAVKTAKLRGARRAYRGLLSESSRARVRRLVLGADASGAARRVVVLATTTGGVLYLLVDTVPATGRRRLMLFSHDDEAAIARAHLAEAFETLDGAFAPPHDPRTRRVAAVTWTLVSTLDPALAVNTDATKPPPPEGETTVSTSSSSAASHPMLREGSRWTVHVVLDADPNAFVLPGGHVFVHSGLLDLLRDDDDALAFVIGHEMGHQLCRHAMEKTTSAMLRRVASAAAWTWAATTGADFLGGAAAVAALDAADAAAEVAFALPNSREMEREADLVGARLAARACYDPLGGARALRALARRAAADRRAAAGEGDDAAMETMKALDTALEAYLSTHPDSESRADALASADVVARAERDAEGCESRRRDIRIAMRGGGRGGGGGGGEAFARARVSGNVGGNVGGAHSAVSPRRFPGRVGLPPNASAENKARVFVPSDAWRRRFAAAAASARADGPRGAGAASARAESARDGRHPSGAMSGPVGRFDPRRWDSIVDPPASNKKMRERRAGAGRSGGARRGSGGAEDGGEVSNASISRGWRGPVRRAKEVKEVKEAAKVSEEVSTFSSSISSQSSTPGSSSGVPREDGDDFADAAARGWWRDGGARRALRAATRESRRGKRGR